MEVYPNNLNIRPKTEASTGSDDVQMTFDENPEDAGSMSGMSVTVDENGRYHLRTETGQGSVYRVIQVTQGEDGQTQMAFLPANDQQDILTNGSTSPTDDARGSVDSRFTFLTSNSEQAQSGDSNPASLIGSSAGQLYLMVSPQEGVSLSNSSSSVRQLAPRFSSIKSEAGLRLTRDDRRRATHNEVERRRRDKINNWISRLGKLVPDCAAEQSKQGDSKGGILAKTCEYIAELQTSNAQMAETLKETERFLSETQKLRQQYEELKLQNEHLRSELRQHGIEPSDVPSNQ